MNAQVRLRVGGLVLLAVALGVFPLVFTNPLVTQVGVVTLLYAAATSGWNSFSGFTGYISLGHAVFFGSGAYLLGLVAQHWSVSGPAVFALLPLCGLLAAAIAVPFGVIALRVRRHTFVVLTIAVFFIFQLMAYNLPFTGGSAGVLAPPITLPAATFNDPFYYIALAIAAASVTMSWLIRRSSFGLRLRAIRDDEDRARGLGVPVTRFKLISFTLSAVPAGIAGGLWMFFIGQVLPQYGFDPTFDLAMALMSFLGGLGTVSGPVLGALIVEPAQQWLTLQFSASDLSLVAEGALFLLVILALPRGIIPTVTERLFTRGAVFARGGDPPEPPDSGAAPGGAGRRPVASASPRPPVATEPDQSHPILVTSQIVKSFGGVQALNGCTLEVASGTIAGLIGPNGSGKTTLFNVITGYERPDAGEVHLDGRPITRADPGKVFRLGVGRTFQLTRIFPRLTVLENMLVGGSGLKAPSEGAFSPLPRRTGLSGAQAGGELITARGGSATRRRAMELLEFTGIADHAGALAGSLSYGQRKLLELSYVLIAAPRLILLDEPAGGVNPSLINHIADRIRQLNADGTTFLIVEHNMEFVMDLCDTITVLDSGTVVASGPPQSIRTNPRVLDAYLGTDFDDAEDDAPTEPARD